MVKSKVFVTGGTGFIGRHLVKALRRRGMDVVCFVRATEDGSFLKSLGAKIVYGDITSRNSIAQAFEFFPGISTVIHLAALIKSTDTAEQQLQNTVGTRHMVDVASQFKAKQFIFTSTDFVLYPDPNPYRDSKLEAEKVLKASSLNYTILRPTPVYGVGDDKNFESVFAVVKKFPVIPSIRCVMQPVHVSDVVKAIVGVMGNPKCSRKEYQLPGGSVVSFDGILRFIARQMGLRRWVITLPNWAMLSMIRVYDILPNPRVRYYQVHKWTTNKELSLDEQRRDFGYRPLAFEDGMAATMRDIGLSKPEPPAAEAPNSPAPQPPSSQSSPQEGAVNGQ